MMLPIDRMPLRRLALAALFLAAASSGHAQTLRWASQGDPQTMDPHSQNESMTNMMNGQVYERLTTRDRQLRIVPALATEWQQVSPLVWRFKLRPNVKFHDGSTLAADDVVYSILRGQMPTSQINNYALAVGTPKKVDDLTVEFTLKEVNPIFLEHLDGICIMSKSWSEKHNVTRPHDFKNKEESFAALNANGTGPYILVSRAPGIKTVYKRNPNYWGQDRRQRPGDRLHADRQRRDARWRRSSRARSISSSTRRRATSPGCAARAASRSSTVPRTASSSSAWTRAATSCSTAASRARTRSRTSACARRCTRRSTSRR